MDQYLLKIATRRSFHLSGASSMLDADDERWAMAREERPVAVASEGTLPSTFSPTAMRDWLQCELKYFFAHVERWRAPASEHTALGDVVHAALDELYTLPAPERTRATADDLLATQLDAAEADRQYAHLVEDEALWADVRGRATESVGGLFALEDPARIEVAKDALGQWVDASLFGAPVRGRIDRTTEAATWTVTDYKTGKVPPPRYVAGALSAVYTYAAALAASHPRKRIPDQVELLYLLGPERIARPVARPHLLEHARTIGRTWTDVVTAHRAATYTARTGPLCGWCAFAVGCPVRSREAPPPGSAGSRELLAAGGLTQGRTRPTQDEDQDLDALADAAEAAQPESDQP